MAAPVLLVHDDIATIASVRRLLARDGFEVILATSAADAVIAFGHYLPSLIILAPSVESGRGQIVLEELAQHPDRALARVLLLGESVPGFGAPVVPLPLDGRTFLELVHQVIRDPSDASAWTVMEEHRRETLEVPALLPRDPEDWRATQPPDARRALEEDLFGAADQLDEADWELAAMSPDERLQHQQERVRARQAEAAAQAAFDEAHREVEAEAIATLENALPDLASEAPAPAPRPDLHAELEDFEREVLEAARERRRQREARKAAQALQAQSDPEADADADPAHPEPRPEGPESKGAATEESELDSIHADSDWLTSADEAAQAERARREAEAAAAEEARRAVEIEALARRSAIAEDWLREDPDPGASLNWDDALATAEPEISGAFEDPESELARLEQAQAALEGAPPDPFAAQGSADEEPASDWAQEAAPQQQSEFLAEEQPTPEEIGDSASAGLAAQNEGLAAEQSEPDDGAGADASAFAAEEERLAAEHLAREEAERAAAAEIAAEEERLAAERAAAAELAPEEERLAGEQAEREEAERAAAAAAELAATEERLGAEQADREEAEFPSAAELTAEEERLGAEQVESEEAEFPAAAELTAEEERLGAEQVESEEAEFPATAELAAEEEPLATEQAEPEEAERAAAAELAAEEERLAAEQAEREEAERAAAAELAAEEERLAAEQVAREEAERAAAAELAAEEDRFAAEVAEREEAERAAAAELAAEEERLAAEQVAREEAERAAAAELAAEEERLAAEQAAREEAERVAEAAEETAHDDAETALLAVTRNSELPPTEAQASALAERELAELEAAENHARLEAELKAQLEEVEQRRLEAETRARAAAEARERLEAELLAAETERERLEAEAAARAAHEAELEALLAEKEEALAATTARVDALTAREREAAKAAREAQAEAARIKRDTDDRADALRAETEATIESLREQAERSAETARREREEREALAARLAALKHESDEAQARADLAQRLAEAERAQLEAEQEARARAALEATLARDEAATAVARAPFDLPAIRELGLAPGGTLRTEELAQLVLRLSESRAELRLDLRVDDALRTLWFQRGLLVGAASSLPHESALARARRDGLIDSRQDAELRSLRGMSQGELLQRLRARGYLRENEVVPLVQRYTEHVALEALAEPKSDYRLADDPPPPGVPLAALPRNPAHLAFEALRRTLDGEQSLMSLGGLGAVPILRAPDLDPRALTLGDRERRFIGLIDGETTVEELLLASGLRQETALRILAAGAALGWFELQPAAQEAAVPTAALELDRLDAKFREVTDADYFSILGLGRSAGGDEVLRAFQQLSLEFDPLKFAGHPDGAVLHRARVVHEALSEAAQVLQDDRLRENYARHLLD